MTRPHVAGQSRASTDPGGAADPGRSPAPEADPGGEPGADGEVDRDLMRRAVWLAGRGWGRVAPNPPVGAVVARGGEVVGEGYHAEFGGEHAEVAALRSAAGSAAGATLYVTLEPCAHRGKTPPCTEAILEAGISRVVVACRDPHPLAAGGLDRLRSEGVEVRVGVEAEAARRLCAPFLWRHTTGRAFAALKLALSLDGKLSRRPGVRSSVTGEAAWREVHRLRAGFEAVMVGRETALTDDPLLTARGEPRPRKPPVRVVLDSRASLSPESRLARSAREAPVWVLAAPGAARRRRAALERAGVRVVEIPPGRGGVDAAEALRFLAVEGVGSVLVEGGGRLAGSLLAEGLLQRLYLIYAPVVYGPGAVEGFPEGAAFGRGEWEASQRRVLGEDTLLVLEHGEAVRRLRDAT